jgi:hypothetical protein
MEQKNEVTYTLNYNIGDVITLKHDPKKRPLTIRGIYLGAQNPSYDVTDFEHSAYVSDNDIENRIGSAMATRTKAIAPAPFVDDNTH